MTPAEMADSLGFLALADRPTLEGKCDACDGVKARVIIRDVPGEALALVIYPPDAAAPVVAELTAGRALDLAADLITAARRRIPMETDR